MTRAARGIGASICLELGSRGASVVVNYSKSASVAEKVVSGLVALGARALEYFEGIDVVVSNAGMEAFKKEEDVTQEDYDEVFDLNIRGQFFVA